MGAQDALALGAGRTTNDEMPGELIGKRTSVDIRMGEPNRLMPVTHIC